MHVAPASREHAPCLVLFTSLHSIAPPHTLQTLLLLSMRWRVQARLKPLAAGVAALYALLAYSAVQYAWQGRGRTPFESRSALAVALGTFLGAAWFASAETRKWVWWGERGGLGRDSRSLGKDGSLGMATYCGVLGS